MSRKAAREIAVKMAFEKLFGCEDTYAAISEISGIDIEPDAEDIDYVNGIIDGIGEHAAEIDEIIGNASNGWTVDRIPKVDISVLRVAVYELLFDKKAPKKVILNEAVRIAKKYGGDDSHRFINGVLANIAQTGGK